MNHDHLNLLPFGLLSTMQLGITILLVVWVHGQPFSRPVYLIYSTAIVTVFGLDYLKTFASNHRFIHYLVVSAAGLMSNYFLTLAFLQAKPEAAGLSHAHADSTK